MPAAHHRVLVVDDERMIRWSVQQALARAGFSAVTAETGGEALALSSEEAPDLVLLDITLPGIDGIETLRRLKTLDPSITVVMVTAVDDLKTAVETMRLGAYDYVSKPLEPRASAGNLHAHLIRARPYVREFEISLLVRDDCGHHRAGG